MDNIIKLLKFMIIALICMLCMCEIDYLANFEIDTENPQVWKESVMASNLKQQLSDIDKLDAKFRNDTMVRNIKIKQAEEQARAERIKECHHKINVLVSMTDCEEKYDYYKSLLTEYPDLMVQGKTIYDEFTEDEIYLICRVVESEVGGGDFGSKSHVAEVVLNRCKYERFGKNVTEVITRPGQFYYKKTKISSDTLDAVEYAYLFNTEVKGAIYFQKGKRNKWSKQPFILKDAVGHCFYGPDEVVQDVEYAIIDEQMISL